VTFSETFELHESAQNVFDALVDVKRVTGWLSEHARIDARPGGDFRFWGRDVIWCHSEAETAGQILEIDPPHSLAFSWRWKGHDSRVAFRLSDGPAGCRVAIEHSFETFAPEADGPGPDMAGCHWRIAVGNLASTLATGHAALRPDYYSKGDSDAGGVSTEAVRLEIEIAAPPAQVFRALLDPAQVRIWMQVDAPSIDPDAKLYSYGWMTGDPPTRRGPSRIVDLVPDRLLVHDWIWPDEPDGQIRWELTPTAVGTRVRLVHTRTSALSYRLGWSDALVSMWRLLDGSAHRAGH